MLLSGMEGRGFGHNLLAQRTFREIDANSSFWKRVEILSFSSVIKHTHFTRRTSLCFVNVFLAELLDS